MKKKELIKLIEDLQADLAEVRAELAEIRIELACIRAERPITYPIYPQPIYPPIEPNPWFPITWPYSTGDPYPNEKYVITC